MYPSTSRLGFCGQGLRCLGAALLLSAASILPACGGESIWTSRGHPAIAPDQIRILIKTPSHYERLGTVTHLYTEGTLQEGGDATPILRDLLSESSALGANVLLLVDDTTMADSDITMKYQGQSYRLPLIAKTKTVLAQGIFVPQE